MNVKYDKTTENEKKLDARMAGTEDVVKIYAAYSGGCLRKELLPASLKMENTYEERR